MAVRTRITILLILLLAAFAAALYFSARRQSSAARETIDQLRANRNDYEQRQKSAAELARLGEEAVPTLAAALKGKDTELDQKYDLWRAKLPAEVQKHLPARPSKDELRRAIAGTVYAIGPNAARPLVGALEYAIDPNGELENTEVLRALYWSIPESAKAVEILSNYLAQPKPGLPLFGMRDADEIWPTVPHLARLLGPWLALTDSAREAAEALALMGTNGHFAIPELIELADKGYVGGPENAKLHMAYTEDLTAKVLPNNQAAALGALGKMGLATEEVLEVLERHVTNASPLLRAFAANALGELGPKAASAVPKLVAHLDVSNREVLRYQIEALGKIGPAAKESVTALLRYADLHEASKIPMGEPLGRTVRWGWEPPDVAVAAAVSVGQIHPPAAKAVLPQIAAACSALLTSNSVVLLRPMREELLPLLEAELTESGGLLLAFNTLVLNPQNKVAAATLRAGTSTTNKPIHRSIAARWIFHTLRETNLALATFRETLPGVTNVNSQSHVTIFRELGEAGRPLAPLVKPLLKHEDRILRMLAGKTLRSIAPDEMPPIIED
jgi:HEAT repeat protein